MDKIGFLTPKSDSLNVRDNAGLQYPIVENLKSNDRVVIQWESDRENDKWLPIRVHRESRGSQYVNGYVYREYATLTTINIDLERDCPDFPTEGEPPKFLDLPIPGWPTLYLSAMNRAVLTVILRSIGDFLEHAPEEIETNDTELELDKILAAVQVIEHVIRTAKSPDPQITSDNKEELPQ